MRLTVRILGTEVFHISTDADWDEEEDLARDLSGGCTTTMPIGFVATFDQPDEVGLPDRYAEE